MNLYSNTCSASISCVWLRCSGYPEVGFITGLNIAIRPFNTRQYAKSLTQRSKKLLTTAKAEMAQGESQKNCLKAARKFKCTTDSKHQMPVAPNLLAQNFNAAAPNEKWAGDITYVATSEGWLYLAVIIDLYSRQVIGWSMDTRITATLVCDALSMALFRRGFPEQVIVHSDRGSQYCSKDYRYLITTYNLKQSMSRKGNCRDTGIRI